MRLYHKQVLKLILDRHLLPRPDRRLLPRKEEQHRPEKHWPHGGRHRDSAGQVKIRQVGFDATVPGVR